MYYTPLSRCFTRPSGVWSGLAHKKRQHNKCKFLLLALKPACYAVKT